jgi:DNA-binding beta-propeller fold protein YncE
MPALLEDHRIFFGEKLNIPIRLISINAAALLTLSLSVNAVAGPDPLELIKNTPLPEITGGDFDHFAVDLDKNRLYVPAEVYASIEVFNLKTGEHLRSATGLVKSPHMLALMPDKHELFVADAHDAACDVLDAGDLHLLKRIALEPGPDFGVYDDASKILYLGNGGKGAQADFSYISLISVDRKEVIDRIRVDAATLKGMRIDPQANRLYVNMRDKNAVGVIDLGSRAVIRTWTYPGLTSNAAMGFDEGNHRLFIGSRNPGGLFILDSNSGKLVATLKTVNISDDMTFDAAHRRLIVSGADGVDVFAQDNPDNYRLVQHVDTFGGKTSVYVPSLKRFYVVHTKGEQAPEAGLQIFKVND